MSRHLARDLRILLAVGLHNGEWHAVKIHFLNPLFLTGDRHPFPEVVVCNVGFNGVTLL